MCLTRGKVNHNCHRLLFIYLTRQHPSEELVVGNLRHQASTGAVLERTFLLLGDQGLVLYACGITHAL